MAIFTVTSRITKRENVTEGHVVARCRNHGQTPSIVNVYTGKKQKFQGTIAECPISDDCTLFGYDAKDVVEKWNKINFP